VRELENCIKRVVIMARGPKLTPDDLQLATDTPYEGMKLKEARESFERDLILKALAKHKGNLTRTAAELDVSRPALYQLMDKLRIKRE
jgi:two-component system NtrC family response regulator